MHDMISHEEAYKIVIASAPQLNAERVGLNHALGRVLAGEVKSDIDMPPFDKSAMDGYAIRREDLFEELEVVETIRAGRPPEGNVGPGKCAKIMTGAMVPQGADCVIMKEYVEMAGQDRIRFVGKDTAGNICYKAEDTKAGETVLNPGEWIKAQHIALLASLGCTEPLVSCQPRVGIIATGDELVEPNQLPGLSQIRNSNSYQLRGQVMAAGAIPSYYGIAKDTERAIDSLLKTAIADSDVLLVSGGVSVGDYDLVPLLLKRNGIKLLFESIAIKPGKPTVFGVCDRTFCFGLPGNPVSTFVIFELLVKPFLLKMMGHNYRPQNVMMPLEESIEKRRTSRQAWYPVILTPKGTVKPIEYHGSAHARALPQADGIICVPAGVKRLEAGTKAHVRQI